MKKLGLFFSVALLITVLIPPVFSLADTAETLPAPEGFSVQVETSYIQINFTGAEKGQYIRIERSTDSDDFKMIATLSAGTTSFKDTGVSNGHIYKYRAKRYGTKASSPYTREIEVIFLYPQSLIITKTYSNQINLEWSYPELAIPKDVDCETVIERKTANTSWTEIYTAPFSQREYRDYGLDPDTLYYYRIRTKFPDGRYSRYIPSTSGISARTTVSPLTALTGYALGTSSIRLEWDRETIEGYTVSVQRMNGYGDYEGIYTSSAADYYIDRDLDSGQEYTYRLMIYSKGRTPVYSDAVTVRTETIPAPSRLAAAPYVQGRITLTWEYPYDVESGFEIWRREKGQTWQLVDTVAKNTTVWTDYSASTDTSYRYRVRAIRGKSAFSSFVVTDWVNNAAPTAPGELLFYPMGSTILIGTDDVVPEGVAYTLEVRTGINDPWRDYTYGQKGSRLLVFFYPSAGKEYDFRVRSENQGNILYGPVYHLAASAPDAPTGLKAASIGSNRVLLAWNDVSQTEDGYHIYKITDQKRTLIGTTARNATSFADTDTVPGSTVSYAVCAYNSRGESAVRSIQVSIPKKAVFKDLGDYSWCADAVNELAASGVISQNADGLFRPGTRITRAEFITLLLKSFDIVPESSFLFSVKDVAPNQWYYPYMMTAVKMGIVIPDQNRYTGPLTPVTKAEMAIYMNRLLTVRNQTLSTISVSYLDRFSDGYQVEEDLKGIIASLAAYGIMPPQGGTALNLYQPATRAEAAVMLYRFAGKYYSAK